MQNTRTAYVILGMLSIKSNLSGYEIHKAIEDNFGSFWAKATGNLPLPQETGHRRPDRAVQASLRTQKAASRVFAD